MLAGIKKSITFAVAIAKNTFSKATGEVGEWLKPAPPSRETVVTVITIVFLLAPMQARLQMGASRKTIERPHRARFLGLAASPRERKDARAKRVNLVAPAARFLPFQSPLQNLAHSLAIPPPLLARSPSTVKENRLGYHKSNPTD